MQWLDKRGRLGRGYVFGRSRRFRDLKRVFFRRTGRDGMRYVMRFLRKVGWFLGANVNLT